MPELYEFQRRDMEKIFATRRGANGGEMGTGKTPFAIETTNAWYEELPRSARGEVYGDLVIAPLNTFDGWQKRYSEWAPEVDVVTMGRRGQPATERKKFLEAIRKRQGDAFIMHWEALRLMPELRNFVFSSIVADEAHRMANRKNQQTRAIKMLRTHHKLAMSGTLTADHPAGLWSPFNWLYPKKLTSYWRFYKEHVDFEIVYPHGYHKIMGVKNVEELHQFMEPFYVRHLKREQCCPDHPQGVMPWLKPVYRDTIWVELSPKQRRVYEQMRDEMLAWVGENEDSPLAAQVAMVKLLRLSQMALATPDIDGDRVVLTEPSSKLDRGIELFMDHPEKKFLAYTSSKQFLNMAVARCRAKGINTTAVSGDVTDANRQKAKDEFISGDAQVLFMMIQTAEGMDGLQENCDTMVFFDRTWSARMNRQAEDRLDRDGQKSSVQIIDIMARNTVDLGNHQRLENKWSWISKLLNMKIDQETGE
jgi:SNF2 family DNA or RNA helicase